MCIVFTQSNSNLLSLPADEGDVTSAKISGMEKIIALSKRTQYSISNTEQRILFG